MFPQEILHSDKEFGGNFDRKFNTEPLAIEVSLY